MRRPTAGLRLLLLGVVCAVTTLGTGIGVAAPGGGAGPGAGASPGEGAGPGGTSARIRGFDEVISRIESLPYQAAYAPAGTDAAFSPAVVANDQPAEDYTSGSIPGSPDSPAWPAVFRPVVITSADGTRLTGELALLPGTRPAVLVVHGFNTHGSQSVIRWAAMLAADGFDVLAADQRDYSNEYSDGYGYPGHPQSFGWKESEDVLAAGRYLAHRPGVRSVGVVGFSEGAQNTVLALAADTSGVFSAGLTFSGPADQDTQIYSTAQPSGCRPPGCTYPASDALTAVVVPPYDYTDVCSALAYAARYYKTAGRDILGHESAFTAQTAVRVPLLNFYAADDPLVDSFQAGMMAGYEIGTPLQRTVELRRGAHAYYYDRWWQQEAILDYFKALLPGAGNPEVTTRATVNQTPGGAPLSTQLVPLDGSSRKQARSHLAPYVC